MKSKLNFFYPLYVVFCLLLLWGYSVVEQYAHELVLDPDISSLAIRLSHFLPPMLMGALWLGEHYLAGRAVRPVILVTRLICIPVTLLWTLRGSWLCFHNLSIPYSLNLFGHSAAVAYVFLGYLITSTVVLLWKKKSE